MKKYIIIGSVATILGLLLLSWQVYQHKYQHNAPATAICNACGNVQINEGYQAATTMLQERYPNTNYTVLKATGAMHSCGACGGTSPAIFAVSDNNTVTAAIITEGASVTRFIPDLANATPDIREDIQDQLNEQTYNTS